jgi:hypothetical protein
MAGSNIAATYTVTVAPVAGTSFSDPVNLTANLPPGFTGVFNPATIAAGSGTSTFSVTAPAGGTGNISASVTATDAVNSALSHSASGGTLAVQDFTLPLSPVLSGTSYGLALAANTPGVWTVVPQGLNGFNQPITLFQVAYQPVSGIPAQCDRPVSFATAGGTPTTPGSAQPAQIVQVGITAPNITDNNAHVCGVTISGTYGASRTLRREPCCTRPILISRC